MQEDFGAYLKAQRELRGITLENISNETKIPLRHLEGLEGNEQDELPDEVFVKGYIKAYADSIGADVDEVLTAYDETVLAPIREEAENQRVIEEGLNKKKKSTLVGFFVVIIISGLALAGYLLVSEEPKSSQPKLAVSTKKIEKTAEKKVDSLLEVDAQQDEVNLKEEPGKNDDSESAINDKPDEQKEIPKDEPKTNEVANKPTELKKPLTRIKEEAKSKPAEPKKVITEKKKNNNTAETGNKSPEQKKQEAASIALKNNVKENRASNQENSVTIQAHKNNDTVKKSETLHLVVKAEQEGWFNLIVDGANRKDFILPAGSSKSFKAKNSINLWIGNKKGTKLILNDKAIQLPETIDNVLRNFVVTAKLLE
jgi:cytoskeleton protein RodZ